MKAALAICVIIMLSVSVRGQFTDFAHADFSKADSIAALYPEHSLKDLRILADKLTKPLPGEVEKFRAIYKWVCNNIEYDNDLYMLHKQRDHLKNPEERAEWNRKFSARVFKTLRERRKTVCTGYAYLVKELCTHAGLTCRIVDGYGRTSQSNIVSGNANHSWNVIQLHHRWYLCDPTWSSGVVDAEVGYIKRFDASYFLADPALFIRNHYPLDLSWTLLDQTQTLKNFLDGPLIYSSVFRYHANPLSPATFSVRAVKGEIFSFQFTGNTEIKKAELQIRGPVRTNYFAPHLHHLNTSLTSLHDASGYSIDHVFTSKGTHIVHVLLNDSYAFTYSVDVR